jgi:hypothetical protein
MGSLQSQSHIHTPNFGMIYFRFAEFAFCIHVIVCLICRNLLIILENRTKLASTHSLKEITQCCILLHCDLDRVKPGSDPFSEICKINYRISDDFVSTEKKLISLN